MTVLNAALAEFVNRGVDDFTLDSVARRASVDVAVVRDLWHDARVLLMEAILYASRQRMPIPDTGSLAEDVLAYAETVRSQAATTAGLNFLRSLPPQAREIDFNEVRHDYTNIRLEQLAEVFKRAKQRGELREGVSPDTVASMLAAIMISIDPVWCPARPTYLREALDIFLQGVSAPLEQQRSTQQTDAEMRYRILAENAVDIVVHFRGSQIVWVSPSAEVALGAPVQRWVGSDVRVHVHPDDHKALAATLRRITAGESVLQRFRVRGVDGGYHWVEGHGKPYMDAEGNTDGVIATFRLIDRQVGAEQRLDRLARFDTLTGLPNRTEAFNALESALDRLRSPGPDLGVLFCDIDNFKQINDTWGHHVGDAVLATVATRIRNAVRASDTVGRIGGDEMLVLLFGVHGLDEAVQIAEKIRTHAEQPIQESGHTVLATLSIGVTIAVAHEPASAIMTRADAAMYQAKMAGRNKVVRVEAIPQSPEKLDNRPVDDPRGSRGEQAE